MNKLNGVIITKETTKEKAMATNNVLMVGRIMNANELKGNKDEEVKVVAKEVVVETRVESVEKPVVEEHVVEEVNIPEFLVKHNEILRRAKYDEFRRQEVQDYIKIKRAINKVRKENKRNNMINKLLGLLA